MEREYWVGFSYVPGIGPTRVRQLLAFFGSLRNAWHAPERALRQAGLDRRALGSFLQARPRIDIHAEMSRLDKLGIAVLTWDDGAYPSLLADLKHIDHAPPVLYMRGSFLEEDMWSITAVGTRRITAYGRQITGRLIGDLASSGLTIVSGLARGIDGEAHKAALEAGGRTIAVLPCGLDTIYPPEHRQLAARILERGALVTPFPLGTPPEAGNFQPRNRLMSGLARGVLVLEAGKKSGSLITAGYALEQGREVFAVPGNITSHSSRGANRLLQDGAHVVLHADDVLDVLNLEHITYQAEARQTLPPMNEAEALLMEHIGSEPVHIDEIVQRCGKPVHEISGTLTMLTLKGMVREVDIMTYVRAY